MTEIIDQVHAALIFKLYICIDFEATEEKNRTNSMGLVMKVPLKQVERVEKSSQASQF